MKDKVKIGLALTASLIACLVIQYFSNFVFDFFIFLLTFLAVKEYKKLQLKAGMPSFDYCPEIACFLVFVASFTGILCGLSAIAIFRKVVLRRPASSAFFHFFFFIFPVAIRLRYRNAAFSMKKPFQIVDKAKTNKV